MANNKTLYVRPWDEDIWQEAEQAAALTRRSVSTLVAEALRAHIPTLDLPVVVQQQEKAA